MTGRGTKGEEEEEVVVVEEEVFLTAYCHL